MAGGAYTTHHECATIPPDETRNIYGFCNSLMAESFESFHRHVILHDMVYLFRKKTTGELIGVSYWRTKPTQHPRVKAIVQGKLRIHKDFRRLGLHARAGFYYYLHCQIRAPLTRFYFLSIASIFNYVSMRKTVGEYYVLNGEHSSRTPSSLALLYPVLQTMLDEDNFTIDKETKAIYVHVTIRDDVLNEFPPSYFQLPEAIEYVKVNPKYRQAHDIAYAYPFTLANVLYILWRILDQSYFRQLRSWLLSSNKKTI